MMMTGFLYHFWYGWLDGAFPGADLGSLLIKVLLDIGVASPLLWIAYFAVLTLVVEGKGWAVFMDRAFHKGQLALGRLLGGVQPQCSRAAAAFRSATSLTIYCQLL